MLHRLSIPTRYVFSAVHNKNPATMLIYATTGTPDFPSLSQIQSYLEGYCDTFSLRPHIKLQHDIKSVTRNKEDTLWKLEYTDSEGGKQVETFDKIIMATGMTAKRLMPIGIAGLENFKGRVLHGQEFKRYA